MPDRPPRLGALLAGLSAAAQTLLPDIVSLELTHHARATGRPWLTDATAGYCPRCGATIAHEAVTDAGCLWCHDQPMPWQRLVRLGPYVSPLDRWLLAMKYAGQWRWAVWFGELLAQDVPTPATPATPATPPSPATDVVVCPVPMPPVRRWRRGYNQARLMAETLASRRGWRVIQPLHRRGGRPPQASLDATERCEGFADVMRIDNIDLADTHVVLVDDIKTTGTTLRTCAELLNQAGAAGITVAIAAVAEPAGAVRPRPAPTRVAY